MANIFDYMNWRDISLEKVEFNEIDNLILSRLSYFPFDGIVNENEEITLKEAYEKTKILGTTGRTLQAEDIDLYPLLAKSIRFGKCKLTKFVNRVEPEGDDLKVDINFDKAGHKRLMAKYANLEIRD